MAKVTVEEAGPIEPPLHAGAYRYFSELGLKMPDSLVPPEAKR